MDPNLHDVLEKKFLFKPTQFMRILTPMLFFWGGRGWVLKNLAIKHPLSPPKNSRPSLEMVLLVQVFSPNPPGWGVFAALIAASFSMACHKFTCDLTWYPTQNWRHSTSIKEMEQKKKMRAQMKSYPMLYIYIFIFVCRYVQGFLFPNTNR